MGTTRNNELGTNLHVVPCHVSKFRDYFVSLRALCGSENGESSAKKEFPRFMGKAVKYFARKVHLFSHLPLRDMKILCQRGGIIRPVLSQALSPAVEKCSSCKTTGMPLNVRKTSLNKLLRTFNDEVQIDFMRIKELTDNPILHMKDNSTGFCAAAIASSRDQDQAARIFEQHWITVHGPPVNVEYDPEYDNTDFGALVKRHNIIKKSRPARTNSKIKSVESGNKTLRVLTARILRDALHQRDNRGVSFTQQEILSRATFARNVLRTNKKLCPFELTKGYMPAIGGFPQTPVDEEISNAHIEQVKRGSLTKISSGRKSNTIPESVLKPKTNVYFFEKKQKHDVWNTGFVQEAKEHFFELKRSKYRYGKRLKVAYEDIRLFLSSSLLQQLDEVELTQERELGNASMEEEVDPPIATPSCPDPRRTTTWLTHISQQGTMRNIKKGSASRMMCSTWMAILQVANFKTRFR